MQSLGDIAASLNVPVFPCDTDKRPVVKTGFKAASRDKSTILTMFAAPAARMIGVPTGEETGLVIVDIDIKNGAKGSDWLDLNREALPQTRTHVTKSGGLHLVFKYPAGTEIRNSASQIAPGVDVRGNGGYVIFPPSPGYTVADNTGAADMPDWLIMACLDANSTTAHPKQPAPYYPPVALSGDGTPYGLSGLEGECEEIRRAAWGSQESTLNAAALKIGALVAGGQLSEGYARSQLMAAASSMPNAPGERPWTHQDIEAKIRRGMKDGAASPRRPKDRIVQMQHPEHTPIGMDEREAPPWEVYFDGMPEPKTPIVKTRLWYIDQPWVETDIPKRPWIVRGFLLRGSLTVISGPGSAGKSSLMVAWAVAMAAGVDYGRFRPVQPYKVLSYNVEDDKDEQMRRVSATCRQFDLSPDAVMPNLRFVGPTEMGTLMHLGPDGRLLINTPVMQELEEYIDQWHPDVVMLDPFVELHSSEENDNTAIRQVLARFRSWAIRCNIALVVLHHARKGVSSPGDPDSMRGASAIVGAARIALTVNTMTDQEADDLGVSKEHRRDYFRLDGAKMNYSRVQDADWFERVEYDLDNDEGVAAALPWNIPKQSVNLSHIADMVRLIERGTPLGPYSAKLSKDPRSIKTAMESIGISLQAAQKELLTRIMMQPEISVKSYNDRARRTKPQGLKTENGPSAEWIDEQ